MDYIEHRLTAIEKSIEKLGESRDRHDEKTDETLEAIRIQVTKINGRVGNGEKEISRLWRGGYIMAVFVSIIILYLVAAGILRPSDITG